MAKIANIKPNPNIDPFAKADGANELSDIIIQDDSFDRSAAHMKQIADVNALMASARGQLGQAVKARIAQPIGPTGTPNFGSLTSDIQVCGDEILNQHLSGVQDKTVAEQFKVQFTNEIKGSQLKAKGLARDQQIAYMKSTFDAEHQSLVQQASEDLSRSGASYLEEYKGKLDAGLTLGLFTEQERNQKLEAFRTDISRAQYNALVESNPILAKAQLEANPERFGFVTKEEKEQARQLVNDKLQDSEVQQRRLVAAQKNDQATQLKIMKEDLKNKIDDGTAGAAEIDRATNLLPIEEISGLKKQLSQKRLADTKANRTHNKLIERVVNGDDLADFTPSVIQDSYSRVLDELRPKLGIAEGDPIPLSMKAAIGRTFKGRIKSLEQDMEHALNTSTENDAIEALNAYRIMAKENPQFTESLHQSKDTAGAIAEYALQLIDRSNVPEQAALQRARAVVLAADDAERSGRASKFSSLKGFKADDIAETAREELGGDPLFGFNRKLAPGVSNEFSRLAREAYIMTGDKDVAKATAARQMQANYGETDFNGGRYIMFAAPEKMFPGVPVKDLKGRLNEELQAAYPGIDSSKVEIVSDDLTKLQKGKISYALQIRDSSGMPVPLVDPNTGQVVRWTLDQQKTTREFRLKKAEELRNSIGKDKPLADSIIDSAKNLLGIGE